MVLKKLHRSEMFVKLRLSLAIKACQKRRVGTVGLATVIRSRS